LGDFAHATVESDGLHEIRAATTAVARRLLAVPGISGDRQNGQLRRPG
jgi:hypothetical protein